MCNNMAYNNQVRTYNIDSYYDIALLRPLTLSNANILKFTRL